MSGGFVIIPQSVALFRVKITGLRCELPRGPHLEAADEFTIDGDFDMFRTFATPSAKETPFEKKLRRATGASGERGRGGDRGRERGEKDEEMQPAVVSSTAAAAEAEEAEIAAAVNFIVVEWPKFELMFIYQTEYVEMLIAKRFRLALNCTLGEDSTGRDVGANTGGFGRLVSGGCCGGVMDTDFVGEAEVDLMTIAAGPQCIVLTLRNGDVDVGRVFATVEMEEISEMRADIRNLVFTEAPLPSGSAAAAAANKSKKKAEYRFGFEKDPPIFEVGKAGRADVLTVKSERMTGQAAAEVLAEPAEDAGGPFSVESLLKKYTFAPPAELTKAGGGSPSSFSSPAAQQQSPHQPWSPAESDRQYENLLPSTPDTNGSPQSDAQPTSSTLSVAQFRQVGPCVHYFSTSLPDLSESAGLVIDVCSGGSVLGGPARRGTAHIGFYKYLWMIDEHRDPDGLFDAARAAESARDDADVALDKAEAALAEEVERAEVLDVPPPAAAMARLQRDVDECRRALEAAAADFEEKGKAAAAELAGEAQGAGWFRLLDRAEEEPRAAGSSGTTAKRPLSLVPVRREEDGATVGWLTGEVHFTFMPAYCQMRAGTTVDGVVCNGLMYQFATIEPPFKSKEHRSRVDAGAFA